MPSLGIAFALALQRVTVALHVLAIGSAVRAEWRNECPSHVRPKGWRRLLWRGQHRRLPWSEDDTVCELQGHGEDARARRLALRLRVLECARDSFGGQLENFVNGFALQA